MKIKDNIAVTSEGFKQLCMNYNVKYIYAFGSATNDLFNTEKSDIDLIVELNDKDPMKKGEH
jgi:uncharacterized protein